MNLIPHPTLPNHYQGWLLLEKDRRLTWRERFRHLRVGGWRAFISGRADVGLWFQNLELCADGDDAGIAEDIRFAARQAPSGKPLLPVPPVNRED